MPDAPEPKKTINDHLEALAYSVELLAKMQIKTEKEIQRLARCVSIISLAHEARLLALEEELGQLEDEEPEDTTG